MNGYDLTAAFDTTDMRLLFERLKKVLNHTKEKQIPRDPPWLTDINDASLLGFI